MSWIAQLKRICF